MKTSINSNELLTYSKNSFSSQGYLMRSLISHIIPFLFLFNLGYSELIPKLNSVCLKSSGLYSASFGYENTDSLITELDTSGINEFLINGVTNLDAGQPRAFNPGTHDFQFNVIFDENPITWDLENHSLITNGLIEIESCDPRPFTNRVATIIVNKFKRKKHHHHHYKKHHHHHHKKHTHQHGSQLHSSVSLLKQRLLALNFKVKVISQHKLLKVDIEEGGLLIIATNIKSKKHIRILRKTKNPIITWIPSMYKKLKMAKKAGFTSKVDEFNFIASHPLASSFKGQIEISEKISSFPWALPNQNAIRIANIQSNVLALFFGIDQNIDPNKIIIDTLEGRIDTNMFIVGRRVGLPIKPKHISSYNLNWWKLFDNSIEWSIGERLTTQFRTDSILFQSDGFNFDSMYTSEDFMHALHRLKNTGSGKLSLPNIIDFRAPIIEERNAYRDLGVMPILIIKDTIESFDLNTSTNNESVFFLASFANEDIVSKKIFVYNRPDFNLSSDSVTKINLNYNGDVIEIVPTNDFSNGDFIEFSTEGLKEFEIDVYFASGFVGTNKFQVNLRKMPGGHWFGQ